MTSTLPLEQGVTSPDVQIDQVVTKQALLDFVRFPFTLYRNDSNWVPPLIEERLDVLNTKKNPFFEHARCQLFLARRNGAVVGTIGAVIDDNHNAFHNERMGAFGFFESIDDQQVATALLQAAEQWVAAQGMTVI